MSQSIIQKIKDYDRSRESIPGEHWLTALAAVALWLGTRRHPSLGVRILGSVTGTLLVARALSGRDVPQSLARWMPFEDERRHR